MVSGDGGGAFEHLVDIGVVKPLADQWVVMHSKDDELDYEQGAEIAGELGAELITYEDRDHFSDEKNAPEILAVLRNKLIF